MNKNWLTIVVARLARFLGPRAAARLLNVKHSPQDEAKDESNRGQAERETESCPRHGRVGGVATAHNRLHTASVAGARQHGVENQLNHNDNNQDARANQPHD